MIKKIFLFALFCVLVGGAYGAYEWFKPHPSIGKPKFILTANELVSQFSKNETEAAKKYVGDDDLIVQITGTISGVQKDSSGISISFETGDPNLGLSCTLDKFSKQPRTDFKSGENITLKGLCRGRLFDINMDRCVVINNN